MAISSGEKKWKGVSEAEVWAGNIADDPLLWAQTGNILSGRKGYLKGKDAPLQKDENYRMTGNTPLGRPFPDDIFDFAG